MGIALGPNQYGKAENRVVRIYRDTDRHEIRDLNVSTSLRGDFTAAHITGDQGDVLPTDTQKNTAFAFAKEKGITSPEQFGITLGAHFLDVTPKANASRIGIEEYAWERIEVNGSGHDHSFVRRGPEVRTAVVTTDDSSGERRVWVVSGVQDLVILKSTGSGFKGFLKDKYTTLQETEDRIMATALTARWRYEHTNVDDWNKTYDDIKRTMLEVFAGELLRGPAADAVPDGQGGAGGAPRGGRDQVLGAQQTPLRGRPVAVRRGEQQRGLHRRRPALRPHRGLRRARGRLRPR